MSIEKLISIASPALGGQPVLIGERLGLLAGERFGEISDLLSRKNGFFAFESALRVFPSESSAASVGLSDWNSDTGWRTSYNHLASECLFFAEDVFGGQFCIKNNLVCSFDPETGALERLAESISEWANLLLKDFEHLTGYAFAHQWQQSFGPLAADQRLIPKIPFVMGGDYALDNLYAGSAVHGMMARGSVAVQIEGVPDGTLVEITTDLEN